MFRDADGVGFEAARVTTLHNELIRNNPRPDPRVRVRIANRLRHDVVMCVPRDSNRAHRRGDNDIDNNNNNYYYCNNNHCCCRYSITRGRFMSKTPPARCGVRLPAFLDPPRFRFHRHNRVWRVSEWSDFPSSSLLRDRFTSCFETFVPITVETMIYHDPKFARYPLSPLTRRYRSGQWCVQKLFSLWADFLINTSGYIYNYVVNNRLVYREGS